MATINKFILVYAHGGTEPNDPGATNVKLNVTERDFIKTFIDKFLIPAVKTAGLKYTTVQQKPNWYSIDELVDAVYEKNDIAISCHLNAAADPKATGTETLHAVGSKNGEKLARLVQTELVKATGLKDRGLKAISKEEVEANLAAGNRLRNGGHGLRLRLGRHRVGVGLERFVDLAKRRIEVIHLDKVRLFPLGQAVIGCFSHRVLPFHHARRTTLSTPMASSMLEKR